MGKKIKILESNCRPELEKTVNKLLKKDWNIRGSIIKGVDSLVVMMEK